MSEQTLDGYGWCTEEMWGKIRQLAHELDKDPFDILEAIDAVTNMSPELVQKAVALAESVGQLFKPPRW